MITRLLAAFLLPVAAHAGDFPRLYEIPADTIVSVRASPSVNATVLANLTAANGQLEVLQVDGEWAEISAPYGESWVRLDTVRPLQPSADIPAEFSCIGTNPTWLLERRDASVFVDFLEGYLLSFDDAGEPVAGGFLSANGPDGPMELRLEKQRCRAEIGDFRYGLSVKATIPDFSLVHRVEGCCSLKR